MSFLAAMLLLNMDSHVAFVALANLLNNPRYFSTGYTPEMTPGQVAAFKDSFKFNLPLLCEHFETHGVTHELYLIDWRLSVFCRILPLDVAVRVWDNFLREGEVYFIKCALGLLKLFAPNLATKSDLGAVIKLLRDGEKVTVEELFESVEQIKVVPISTNGGDSGVGLGRGARGRLASACSPS